jgi:nucleotide-binding universal stress UspA family protein
MPFRLPLELQFPSLNLQMLPVLSAQEAVGKIPGELPTELIEGSPAEAIINVAKTRGSSVIVMGSRGLSSMAELMLGSTSHKVVSHAACPVLIVR